MPYFDLSGVESYLPDLWGERMGKVINISSAKFSVGQLVHHRLFDYRGVIVDVDRNFQRTDRSPAGGAFLFQVRGWGVFAPGYCAHSTKTDFTSDLAECG